jgi:hypothetical protein
MNEGRGRRHDNESRIRQEKEDRDTRMFWDMRKGIVHEPCLVHKCGSCPQDKFMYCEDIAMATMATIKEKYSMDDCQWSISERLAKEFPGAGFEKNNRPKKWVIVKKDGTRIRADSLPLSDESQKKLETWHDRQVDRWAAGQQEDLDFTHEN